MADQRIKPDILTSGNPFKVVGLVASVITTLAVFVGAVMWVALNMADNTVSIESLRQGHQRHEILITKNSEVLNQHAQVLTIIREQGKAIDVLTDFMTQGGRFTEKDGAALYAELQKVKERLQHYEILETELSWIKKSIGDLEMDIRANFQTLGKQINKIAVKQDAVYEGHSGRFEEH